MRQHSTVARVAEVFQVAWDTANTAIIEESRRILADQPGRFDNVTVAGEDEHCWRHIRGGHKYVTVIIDLTPVPAGTGCARLLDMVPGRSKQVFKQRLAGRPTQRWDGVKIVAMGGFTGFNSAAAEELPDAAAVVVPFHVMCLAGEAVDKCRQWAHQHTIGHCRRRGDPLFQARRILLTGANLLTARPTDWSEQPLADEGHVEVEATWGVYQRPVQVYRCKDNQFGKFLMHRLLVQISSGVPAEFVEVTRLGRTLKRRAENVTSIFDRPGTSNGPTEAINGSLELLHGSTLGFRNLTNLVDRRLLEAGRFSNRLHSQLG